MAIEYLVGPVDVFLVDWTLFVFPVGNEAEHRAAPTSPLHLGELLGAELTLSPQHKVGGLAKSHRLLSQEVLHQFERHERLIVP